MKYKLLKSEFIFFLDETLYRIEALKDFSDVKKGDKGGWISSEDNLSQEGNCWVYDSSIIYGNAKVFDNARIFEGARVFGEAKVLGRSLISKTIWLSGRTIVINSEVSGNYHYTNYLIIPKDHPDFWDYRLEYPDLKIICV